MPSYNLIAFVGLSFLVASSVAPPPPSHNSERSPLRGPWRGPPRGHHRPSGTTTIVASFPTGPTGGSGGEPIFPTGGFPTGIVPSGTAIPTGGPPVVPWPTDDVVDDEHSHMKRFEGPRGRGPLKPWRPWKGPRPAPSSDGPTSPPFVTGGPRPTGTGGPGAGPTGGPTGTGFSAPTGVFPTAY